MKNKEKTLRGILDRILNEYMEISHRPIVTDFYSDLENELISQIDLFNREEKTKFKYEMATEYVDRAMSSDN